MNGSHSLVPVPELWRPLFLCCLGLRQWAALINPLQTKLSGKTRTHWPSAPKEERHEHSCLLKRKTSTSSLNSRKIGEEKTPWRSPTHNETIALVCKKYFFMTWLSKEFMAGFIENLEIFWWMCIVQLDLLMSFHKICLMNTSLC